MVDEETHVPQPVTGEPPHPMSPNALRWLLALALACATALVFAPALSNEFVNWDDDVNIVHNTAYRGFDARQLDWMFTTTFGGHYQPLTWLSYAADYTVWDVNPFGFHLSNIVLHAIGVVLFFFIACRLLQWVAREGAPAVEVTPTAQGDAATAPVVSDAAIAWCAAFAAAAFALHPLRVESVVWATERRDVLSGAFLFACVLAYLAAIDRRNRFGRWYVLAILFYVLSLLSKASGMTLPVVLLVIDIYPARRQRRGESIGRLIVEKIPFLALGVAAAVIALIAQRSAGSLRSLEEIGIVPRLILACFGALFYLYNFTLPLWLSPLYPLPPASELVDPVLLLSTVAVVVAVVFAIAFRRRFPALLAGTICYLALLAPTSGIAQAGSQFAADRYTYLSLLPVALLLAGFLLRTVQRHVAGLRPAREVRFVGALAGTYVFAIAMLTLAQTQVWADSISLWGRAVDLQPESSIAEVNLADALRQIGHFEAAAYHYQVGVEEDPTDAKAHNGWGVTLLHLGDRHEALEQITEAVKLDPTNPGYRSNLGRTLAGFGRLDEAAQQYAAVLGLQPDNVRAASQLSSILEDLGRFKTAEDVLVEARRRSPENLILLGDLAWLLATAPAADVHDPARAVKLAERLCTATDYEDPYALRTLAVAAAAAGDSARAAKTARLALDRAEAAGVKDLAADLRDRLRQWSAATQPAKSGAAAGS